jgi:Mor family transcriptional regulator
MLSVIMLCVIYFIIIFQTLKKIVLKIAQKWMHCIGTKIFLFPLGAMTFSMPTTQHNNIQHTNHSTTAL